MTADAKSGEDGARLRTLDLLRGLAILGVLAMHAVQAFASHIALVDMAFGLGRFGVQLFFIVSAITMCVMWRRRSGESHPAAKFYLRRVLRIAPLFWLAIPLYLALDRADPSFFTPDDVSPLAIVLTVTFLHGFWPTAINSVVPGGWSIAVEMTFYAVFPLLIGVLEDRPGGGRGHLAGL